MPTLWHISNELQELGDRITDDQVDTTDPEIMSDIERRLDEVFDDLDSKAQDYASLIADLLARAEARRQESRRLRDRADVDENAAKTLKDRLKDVMENRGMKKIETTRYRITVSNNGGKLPIDFTTTDTDGLPEQYIRRVESIDADAVRNDLESGVELAFARLLRRGTHLRIA